VALKEVIVAAVPSASGRTIAGDIIDIRDPVGYCGQLERNNFLWLLMDDSRLPDLETISKLGPVRAVINLAALASQHGIDIARIRDPRDPYQPFLNPRASDGLFQSAIEVHPSVTFSLRANPQIG
jgi:hypothetical protein